MTTNVSDPASLGLNFESVLCLVGICNMLDRSSFGFKRRMYRWKLCGFAVVEILTHLSTERVLVLDIPLRRETHY